MKNQHSCIKLSFFHSGRLSHLDFHPLKTSESLVLPCISPYFLFYPSYPNSPLWIDFPNTLSCIDHIALYPSSVLLRISSANLHLSPSTLSASPFNSFDLVLFNFSICREISQFLNPCNDGTILIHFVSSRQVIFSRTCCPLYQKPTGTNIRAISVHLVLFQVERRFFQVA